MRWTDGGIPVYFGRIKVTILLPNMGKSVYLIKKICKIIKKKKEKKEKKFVGV